MNVVPRWTWALTGSALIAVGAPAGAQTESCSAAPELAQVFRPDLADSGKLFRGQFSPDGREFYYFKKITPGQEDYRIYVSTFRNGRWTPGERMLIGGEHSELYPTVTPDGDRLIFSSYQPVPGDTSAHPNAYLYVAARQAEGWGQPVLQVNASRMGWYHSGPMIGPDGALYFSITSPDWRTISTLRSEWNGTEYGAPEPYTLAERWRQWQTDRLRVWGAQPTPGDTVMLVYASARRSGGGTSETDIYASFRRGVEWTEPRLLGGEVNTEGSEGFAFVSPDGCELLFTRNYSRFYHVSLAIALAAARTP